VVQSNQVTKKSMPLAFRESFIGNYCTFTLSNKGVWG
jgi:hypothetical protein